jgi:hypothetical protein
MQAGETGRRKYAVGVVAGVNDGMDKSQIIVLTMRQTVVGAKD